MKQIKRLLFFIALLGSMTVFAQKFKTHAVKQGETLSSIARMYRVTPYNILKYNKEIKNGDELQPNTILVIPVTDGTGTYDSPPPKPKPETPAVLQEEPISFYSHKVRKRETLFSIAKRYKVSEEDIKRYNSELYASQLRKGMKLRIPKYRQGRETEEIAENEGDYLTYKVSAKETRWSIAHKYGITVDSLLALNPALSASNDYLAEGQELKLPKPMGSSLEGQDVQLFESYTVPSKKTLYAIGKEYGISSQEILRLNPEVVANGGLKEGMILRLPKKKAPETEVNTDNFVFYVVKPKQTTFSLTRNLNISYQELVDLNPDLVMGLKAGMVLKIPREKALGLQVKNSLVLDRISLVDSIDIRNNPRLMVLLPFRLDKLDLNDASKVETAIKRSNALKYSLGLYTGMLVAADSVAEYGVNVDVKTYDTRLDAAKIREILAGENLGDYNAIVGPLQTDALREVASRAAPYQVPVLAPLAAESEVMLDNVFFTVPREAVMREKMLTYMDSLITDQNIIIIADSAHLEVEEKILERFPAAKVVELLEEEKNISIDLESFALLLSEEKENWVFVESDNFKIVSSVTSILNSSNTELTPVRMFTTNKGKAFENEVISGAHLSNLRFTFPSIDRETRNDAFVKRYRERWGHSPDRYAIRGFDLAYDLLLKLAYRPDLFSVSSAIGETEYSANKFNFTKAFASGYYNTASYIMQYDNMRIKEIKSTP